MKYCLASLLFVLLTSPVYAETLTMTTYYPAPFGAYDRMRFVPRADLAGNCSIGTLYVKSSSSLPEYCRNDGTGTGEWGPLPGVWVQDSANHIYPGDTATNTGLQVGIGTSAPSSQLHISQTNANATLRIIRTDGGGDLRITSSDTKGTMGTANAMQLDLQTNNTSRVVILSDGKVGINTPAPTNDLELTGNQKIIGYLILDGNGTNSTLRFVTGGTTFAAGIDSADGNFKINTGTTPGFNQQFMMDTAGNVTIGGKLYVKSDNTNTGEVKLRWVDSGADSGYYAMYSP